MLLLCFSSVSLPDLGGQSCAPDGGPVARSLEASVTSFVASPPRVYVDEEMTFFLNATSTLSVATFSVTIYFDYYLSDGVTVNPDSPVFSTSVEGSSVNVETAYAYDHLGNSTDSIGTFFYVRGVVNDGDRTAIAWLRAYVVENTAPSLRSKPPATIYPDYGLPYNMSYVVRDWDNEPVTVTWDFGDGTEPAVNETIGNATGAYVWQNHTWVVVLEPGRDSTDLLNPYYVLFSMSVSFADSFGHVIYSNHTVNITPPKNYVPTVSFTVESTQWSPGFALPFYVRATDPEGDPLTWTYVFSDSVGDYLTEVYHTDPTEPGTDVWQNTTHTYESAGDYTVTVYISDALPPYQVGPHNYSQTMPIAIRDNKAPGVLANITVSPTKPVIDGTLGYAEVLFSIQASDPDGDVLYLHWDFGDGSTADNRSAGGMSIYAFSQVHRYTAAGEYNVSVLVDDDRGHKVVRYKVILVQTDNSPPSLVYVHFGLSNGVFATPGSTVNITITVLDRERDPVTLWVDFGDNSSLVRVELTEFSGDNTATAELSHVYDSAGMYNVIITYTDWQFGPTHNVTVSLALEVKVPRVFDIRSWDWWDYTSLSLLLAGIGAVFARWVLLGRFRKELDRRGLSLEEYKVITTELKAERDAELAKIDRQVREGSLDPVRAKEMKADVREGYARDRKGLRHGSRVEIEGGA